MEHLAKIGYDKVHTTNNVHIFVALIALWTRSKILQIFFLRIKFTKAAKMAIEYQGIWSCWGAMSFYISSMSDCFLRILNRH